MTNQDRSRKTSTGPNARPRDDTIAQTGPGFPDDTGGNPEPAEEEAKAEKLAKQFFKRPGKDRAPEGRPQKDRPADHRGATRRPDKPPGR